MYEIIHLIAQAREWIFHFMDKLNITFEFEDSEDAECRLLKIFEFLLADVPMKKCIENERIRYEQPANNFGSDLPAVKN